jgi:hypothetical protein
MNDDARNHELEDYFHFPDVSVIPPLYPTDLHPNASLCRRANAQDLLTLKKYAALRSSE